MSDVTFRGITLKAASEGAHIPTLGSEGNERQVVPMARAKAAMFKEQAFTGTAHTIVINFFAEDGEQDNIRARVQSFYEMDDGDLDLPGYATLNDCIFVGKPAWGAQQKVTRDSTAGWRMPCTVNIMQLAPQT
jgi:hypothetical protein